MTDPQETSQAKALGRWLEDGTGEIDGEAAEAVYALRPDLAPQMRLSADDILASVTRGPLADEQVRNGTPTASSAASRSGAEVVPFPTRHAGFGEHGVGGQDESSTAASTPGRRHGRLWMWVGGTGGLGMALVAAATLLLVATPLLLDGGPAKDMGAPERAAAPAAQVSSSVEEREGDDNQAADVPAVRAAKEVAAARDEAIPMADGAATRSLDVIPELAEAQAGDAFGLGLDGWASDLSGGEQSALTQALQAAAQVRATDPEAAARLLEPFVTQPARAGQHVAALVAADYIAAALPERARAVQAAGLALSTEDSPERSALEAAAR